MPCPRCQREPPADAKFRPVCNVNLPVMRCGSCGTENTHGDHFCTQCGQALEAPSDAQTLPKALEAGSTEAARHQVTVMFCDLIDSTAPSTRLDPI